MPSDVAAATDMVELRGMGGGERGDFELDGARGTFERGTERTEILGFIDRSGGGRFELSGLSGECGFSERDVPLSPNLSVNAERLIYSCAFGRDGRPIDAELFLEASKGKGLSAFRYERGGVLLFEDQEIAVKSVHHFEGGRAPTLTPLGYRFELDGRQIGAMDLNGLDKTLYLPREPKQREAVLAASLALSVFWDPADSD